MTITNPLNVLIVGAGASADFGLPLGGPLLTEVRDELRFQAEQMINYMFEGRHNKDFGWSFIQEKRRPVGLPIRDFPIWLWLQDRMPKLENEHNISNGRGLYYKRLAKIMTTTADLLDEQTSETIDDFIAMNSDSSELVKLAIACVFYRILYTDGNKHHAALKELHTRALDLDSDKPNEKHQRRNWVHLLINIVRHAAYNNSLKDGQRIRIISFNYDGILESVLNSQFGNTGYPFKPWQEYIEIIHPHGWMGNLPKECSDMKETIEKWASKINVVNEKKPSDEVKLAREKAALWVSEADKIYMTGFALSAPNAKMLNIGTKTRTAAQEWYVHNYDGSPGLKYSSQSYERDFEYLGTEMTGRLAKSPGSIKVFLEGGTKDAPMTIANWFQIGVPGEMPG